MTTDDTAASLYLLMGQRIRQRRQKRGFTQSDVADASGIARSSLANIERGHQYAPVHVLAMIAECLDVEIADLVPTRKEISAAAKSRTIHGLVLREGRFEPLRDAGEQTLLVMIDELKRDLKTKRGLHNSVKSEARPRRKSK
jgi:transcriptional regulator with XRE-family HTH domain